ncbi:hypothetical protein [Nocardioides sp.]|uniref:hypothetical protein n=1 Tax=Nocardioides sp. TaxID=35761 RepID=UPI0035171A4E
MSTVLLVALAAVGLFVVLLGALFGVVWLAGERNRRDQARAEHLLHPAAGQAFEGQVKGAA